MPLDEAVRATKQEHMRLQGMTPGQHAQILQNNRVKERCHQLVRRRSCFLQAIDVGFGKHTAFAGHLVQLYAVVSLVGEFPSREF